MCSKSELQVVFEELKGAAEQLYGDRLNKINSLCFICARGQYGGI